MIICQIYSGHTKWIKHEKEPCIEVGFWRPFQDKEAKSDRNIAAVEWLQTYIDLASPVGKNNCFDENNISTEGPMKNVFVVSCFVGFM